MPELTWWLTSLLALAALTGFTLLVSVCFKLKARLSFLPTNLVAMICLYLASLAGILWHVSIAMTIIGLTLSSLFALKATWRSKARNIEDITLFLTITAGFWCVTALWLRDFRFVGYDEFTHWALMAKYLTTNHMLPIADGQIAFMQYAPGTALIQYFFASLSDGAEQAVLFGHLTLFFSCLLFLTSQTSRAAPALAVITWSVLATYVLRYDLSFTFVDAMLGGLLAAGFVGAITVATHSGKARMSNTIFILAPVIAYLPLVKHVGLVLGLVVIAAYTIAATLHYHRQTLKKPWYSTNGVLSNSLAFLAILIASYLSWKLHYQSLGIPDEYQQVITLRNALDFFLAPTDETHLAVWQTFGKRMSSSVGIVTLVLILWSVLFILFSNKTNRSVVALVLLIIALGFLGYLALLLISYAFFFVGDERIHLASFERYARSYQLGWLLLLIALPTIPDLWAKASRWPLAALALLAGCVGLVAHPLARSSLIERSHIHGDSRDKRVKISELAAVINQKASDGANLYFFDALGDGLSWYMLKYELAGRSIKTCWSARAILPDGSRGAPNADCEKDLKRVIDNHDYLILFSLTPELSRLNHGLLPDGELQAPMVYKINKTNSGRIWLSPIDKQ
jgi:hypothetical protein